MFLVFALSCASAHAYSKIEYYGNTPVRTYYNDSTGVELGSNAAFTPENTAKAGAVQRQIKFEEQYLDNLKNSKNINVNVNHNGYYYPNRGYYYSYPPLYNSRGNRIYPMSRNVIYPNGYQMQTYYGNGIRIPTVRMF